FYSAGAAAPATRPPPLWRRPPHPALATRHRAAPKWAAAGSAWPWAAAGGCPSAAPACRGYQSAAAAAPRQRARPGWRPHGRAAGGPSAPNSPPRSSCRALEGHGLADEGVQVSRRVKARQRDGPNQPGHGVRQGETVVIGPVAVAAALPAVLVFGRIL